MSANRAGKGVEVISNGNGETRPCSVVPDPEHFMLFCIQHADPDSTLHLDADLVPAFSVFHFFAWFVFQFLAHFYIVLDGKSGQNKILNFLLLMCLVQFI